MATPKMTRDEFIAKYGQVFVADDKGGNAASEVAGQNTGEYYDTYLAPGAKTTRTIAAGEYGMDPIEVPLDFGGGRYSNSDQAQDAEGFDAWDNVDPHPTSNRGNGLDEFWKQVGRPIAAGAAMYTGVGALGGAGAGAAAASPASGLAGKLGMDAGWAATALNTGAVNTGVSLVSGKNLSDSLKSGVTAAALSGVGGWAKDTIGTATAELGSTVSKGLSTVGSGALTGAVGASLTGQDVGNGAMNGIIASGMSTLGNTASSTTRGIINEAGGNELAAKIAGDIAKTVVTGGDISGALGAGAANAAVGQITGSIDGFGELSKDQQGIINSTIAASLRGKKVTPALVAQILESTGQDVKKKSTQTAQAPRGW